MELIQLKQLVSISEEKVLSRAAEKLNISQSALSRSIQKLEDELGISLFDRKKNSMTLNENGKAITERAKIVLRDEASLFSLASSLKNAKRVLRLASCAPAPLWKLTAEIPSAFPDILVQGEMAKEEEIVSLLLSKKADFAVSIKAIKSEAIESVPFLTEQLFMQIPLSDPLSKKTSIRFSDLAGKEIKEYTKTGFWHALHRQMIENAKYIEYDDIMVYLNAIKDGKSLTFVTALANTHEENRAGCATVPITDDEATANYHLAFLKKRAEEFGGVVEWIVKEAKSW